MNLRKKTKMWTCKVNQLDTVQLLEGLLQMKYQAEPEEDKTLRGAQQSCLAGNVG